MEASTSKQASSEWDLNLPTRLFATDRYPKARLNVYCKPDILSFIRSIFHGTPEFDTILQSCFGPLFDLPVSRSPSSCKLIHSLLCRQLITKQKYELWTVFGGQPLRFSLIEFGALTGLPCGEFLEDYDPESEPTYVEGQDCYWNELIGKDKDATLGDVSEMLLKPKKPLTPEHRVKLAYLLIVDGVLISSNQTGRPTFKYVEMLADIKAFLAFPWGRESFMKTIASMRPGKRIVPSGTGKKLVSTDPVKNFAKQLQQITFRLKGFPLALQLLAFRNIPGMVDLVTDDSTSMTIQHWNKVSLPKQLISLSQIHALEHHLKDKVDPYIILGQNVDKSWGEWDDEVKDKKVAYMSELILRSNNFNKSEWPGGDDSLPFISIPKDKVAVVHKRHIVERKKKPGQKKSNTRLRVKSQSPKSKHRYATRSRSSLTLCDDENSSLMVELKNQVAELSKRVLKLEKINKAIIFKRSRKLSSRCGEYASRSRRMTQAKVPVKSQTTLDDMSNEDPCATKVNADNFGSQSDNDLPMANNNEGYTNQSEYNSGIEQTNTDLDMEPQSNKNFDTSDVAPQSPEDILVGDGVQHNWKQYREVFGQLGIPDVVDGFVEDSIERTTFKTPVLGDDPMDVLITPLPSEEPNKPDTHQGNPIYDTANKDSLCLNTPYALEGNEYNPSCSKVKHIDYDPSFDKSDNLTAIKSPMAADIIQPLTTKLQKQFEDEFYRLYAPQSVVDTSRQPKAAYNPLKETLATVPVSEYVIDTRVEPMDEDNPVKPLVFAEDVTIKETLVSVIASQKMIDTPMQQISEHNPQQALVFVGDPVFDTTSKSEINNQSSPTEGQIFLRENIDGQNIVDNQDKEDSIVSLSYDNNSQLSNTSDPIEEDLVDVSDSSPARSREKPILSEAESFLVAEFLSKPKMEAYQLLPLLKKADYAQFLDTLSSAPNTEHVTDSGFLFPNSFLLKLAKPQNWVSTLHMEVLVELLSSRLATRLATQRAAFVEPWFANHLQGKYKSFKAAKIKSRVRWSDPMKRFIVGPTTEWFTDIDTIYVPMIWNSSHWVGLSINLGVWEVEILDPNTDLNPEEKVKEFIEPVVTLLPHLIQRYCKPACSQNHGLKPFLWRRIHGVYKNVRSGDCGPVAMKFLEIMASDKLPDQMEKITDKHVDSFRRQYAMDIYEHLDNTIPTFHMPAPLLAKIVSYVAEDGVDALKNWVRAGPEGKAAVYSLETLHSVRLDRSRYFMWWSMPHSIYYHFYSKCLLANNRYAMTAERNKGIAYENLVEECYRPGLWAESYGEDGGWFQIDGAYWVPPRKQRRVGTPSLTNNAPDRADINGYRIPFKLMDRNQVVLRCEATGQTALDFDSNYRRFGHTNIILALAWWRIDSPTMMNQRQLDSVRPSKVSPAVSTSAEFHIPAPLLAKIVSYVARDGVDALKNWVKAGPEGKAAVYSKETLSCVRLDRSKYFMWWSMPHSIYYPFFKKCLEEDNPFAVTAILHKSLAYGNLVEECYRPGLWAEPFGEDGGWVRIDGPYWINPRWIQGIGRPRCTHCKRASHYDNSCPTM
ncbi:hypothetical protein ISN45_Aa03g034320 [Arabidopsis thaliana x Arabidopsis arenosa]|uniref:Ubiquitin-like protease family profile domain-containing protein n=1 Tax=Arabidopsis thaliana x Arabidopsis arenosa TaxID=1240361 RepID=A0A8T2AY95_9BRAS|nr:hypothetical protein ISN45_Aa03g034320 [Arabidopsis thaliana x Arabidopsis arenosa]